MKLKDWLRPPQMFFQPEKSTVDLLQPKIQHMLKSWEKVESKTDKNVFKALIKISIQIITFAERNPKPTKEVFSKLWNENYLHVMSSKYKHRVHNTAAMIFSDMVLRELKEEFK